MNNLEKLVGCRFTNLTELKKAIEKLTNREVCTIIESESERLKGTDFMIDYEFIEQEDVYTLFYLKDNAHRYYITEV